MNKFLVLFLAVSTLALSACFDKKEEASMSSTHSMAAPATAVQEESADVSTAPIDAEQNVSDDSSAAGSTAN